MTQATIHADTTSGILLRFWHCMITVSYFLLFFVLFSEVSRIIKPTLMGSDGHDPESIYAVFAFACFLLASVCAVGVGRFIAVSSHRNSKERLGSAHRALYFATLGLGWFGVITMAASLVVVTMFFSNAKFSPGHQLGATTQPVIEAR